MPADALPSGIPTHFAFGVAAGKGDTWMPQSGAAWDYRYQYLVGGVNTGSGWEWWDGPGDGTFALDYANESSQLGYIPVFPYYELLQSNGTCGSCNEAQKDLSNLNNPGLMASYYQNFILLMKRLGPGTYDGIAGYGKLAVINIEPDFAGGYAVQAANNSAVCYGFCSGQGNDPTLVQASVQSSGVADVANLPNTYAGYVQALAAIRTQYAPNVLLGLDVSTWATGDDIGVDTNPNLDVTALGQSVGSFMSNTGPHDVLFNNPLDRDAGYYKYVLGQNRFWDRLNVAYPNFTRYEQFLNAISTSDANRTMYLWQVPIGNQYYDTVDNSWGHYQDNRAEYFFGHVPELIQSRIVAVLFGAGNSGSTTNYDADGDGITNPPSFCTGDGLSSGQICNSHSSSVSDDDGGFLRNAGARYYQHPIGLGGGGGPTRTPTMTPRRTRTPTATLTVTPTPLPVPTFTTVGAAAPSTVTQGTSVTLTALVKSSIASSALIDVEVYNSTPSKVFQQFWDAQTFAAGQKRQYTASVATSALPPGTYSMAIGVFSPGWGTLYTWNAAATSFTVQ
jgi:hypothetical protein